MPPRNNETGMTEGTAVITGASEGIGYELTRIFAENGYDVVMVARSEDRMNEIADEVENEFGISAQVIKKDLSVPGSSEEVYEEAPDGTDVLVNNAGIGTCGFFHENDVGREVDTVRLNAETPTHLTRLFVEDMVGRDEGSILNVSSMAAFQPGPTMAVYYATKAYLLSFSEALSNELKGTGVSVTALCPGPTETGFIQKAGEQSSRINKGDKMSQRTVAEAGYRGLMKEKTVVVPGFKNRMLVRLTKVAPKSLVIRVARYLQEPTSGEA
jgi:short-subunit dehydrogenase